MIERLTDSAHQPKRRSLRQYLGRLFMSSGQAMAPMLPPSKTAIEAVVPGGEKLDEATKKLYAQRKQEFTQLEHRVRADLVSNYALKLTETARMEAEVRSREGGKLIVRPFDITPSIHMHPVDCQLLPQGTPGAVKARVAREHSDFVLDGGLPALTFTNITLDDRHYDQAPFRVRLDETLRAVSAEKLANLFDCLQAIEAQVEGKIDYDAALEAAKLQ